MPAKRPKKVVAAAPRAAAKQVGDLRALLPGHRDSADRLCWRFGHADADGPWSLGKLTKAEVDALGEAMVKFESMTVTELFKGSPGKDYEVARIPNKDALARLDEIQLSDMTQISCLRIGGKGRLYGFRVDNVFHLVWWDPEHEVWPTEKKHT